MKRYGKLYLILTLVRFLQRSDYFLKDWSMVHCFGAIDGKHIAIEYPKNSGMLYYKIIRGFSTLF